MRKRNLLGRDYAFSMHGVLQDESVHHFCEWY